MATASSDHTVKIWNVDGFTLEKTLIGIEYQNNCQTSCYFSFPVSWQLLSNSSSHVIFIKFWCIYQDMNAGFGTVYSLSMVLFSSQVHTEIVVNIFLIFEYLFCLVSFGLGRLADTWNPVDLYEQFYFIFAN